MRCYRHCQELQRLHRLHIRAAIKAGANREEVAETVSVAIMMGGGPGYMYGARALKAFDQLSQ
ncbi:carboxymuconolactone decarboxylase family protein [Aliiroseovarius sp. F47248L]|uniref:carboxymuconolactone decarboxylase family protein n=1 Tax=Aliiroseovarius sp. F47248L TaxID=2926420 RepID=UPI001FF5D42C|nr:carboxymuconolactone decarboxylase family protein [Aliiroseovarius sp. F47248L]MCK0139014.1 carboxymuconolactone decarboxylase family protein [Aliiroseovarius sp. F47248L]